MELTAVPMMGSANVPQDGLAFTVHKVSDFCYPSLVYSHWQNFSLVFSHFNHRFLPMLLNLFWYRRCNTLSPWLQGRPCISTVRVLITSFGILFSIPSEEDNFWLQLGIPVEESVTCIHRMTLTFRCYHCACVVWLQSKALIVSVLHPFPTGWDDGTI